MKRSKAREGTHTHMPMPARPPNGYVPEIVPWMVVPFLRSMVTVSFFSFIRICVLWSEREKDVCKFGWVQPTRER